jgi:hypothetical protein
MIRNKTRGNTPGATTKVARKFAKWSKREASQSLGFFCVRLEVPRFLGVNGIGGEL